MWVGTGVTQPLGSIFDLVAYSSARLHFIAAAVRLHYAVVDCMIIEISLTA